MRPGWEPRYPGCPTLKNALDNELLTAQKMEHGMVYELTPAGREAAEGANENEKTI